MGRSALPAGTGKEVNMVEHSSESVRRVQEALRAWLRTTLQAAGYPVEVSFTPLEAPHLRVVPLRVVPQGRSGDPSQGIALIPLPENARELQGMGRAWIEYANVLSEALEVLFPRIEARTHGARGRPNPEVGQLPKVLRSWYLREAREPEAWRVDVDGLALARPPALTWRPAQSLTLQYLLAPQTRPEEWAPILASLQIAAAIDARLGLSLPPLPLGDECASYTRALAQAVPTELSKRLNTALHELQVEREQQLIFRLGAESDTGELLRLLVSAGLGFGPVALVHLQVQLGAGALFTPTAAPAMTSRPLKPGESA